MASPVNVQFALTGSSVARFNAAFKALAARTKRELPNFTNKVAYSVALKARKYTPAATAAQIEENLTRDVTVTTSRREVITPGGKISQAKKLLQKSFTSATDELPLMVAIIQSRSRPGNPNYRGPSPWYGVPRALGAMRMNEAIRKFLAARKSSVNFYKAGWLAAIMGLRRAYRGGDLPPMSDHDQRKQANYERLGSFEAATESKPRAKIVNHTLSRFDKSHTAIVKVGTQALKRAFDEEAASMLAEAQRRVANIARSVGIQLRG